MKLVDQQDRTRVLYSLMDLSPGQVEAIRNVLEEVKKARQAKGGDIGPVRQEILDRLNEATKDWE